MIAIFGNKSFQVSDHKVYTLDNFTTSGNLQTEKQDVIGKKPNTYIKGPDLDTMSFDIPLNASLGVNIEAEYNDWIKIKNAGKPYVFVLGEKMLGENKWLLKSVSLSNTVLNAKGIMIKANIQLQFDEYVRAGTASASKSSSTKISAPAITTSEISQTASHLLGPNVIEKTEYKRENPNIPAIVSKRLEMY